MTSDFFTGPNGEPLDSRVVARELMAINDRYEQLSPQAIIEDALNSPLFNDWAIVSSFGAESAVLLHMVAQVKPDTPVLLINTLKLFGETLQYQTQLQHQLGLEDVRIIGPRKSDLEQSDPLGTLSGTNPDLCCAIRKTAVLDRALKPFKAWVNGRKRYQSSTRSMMEIVERDNGRFKLSPLANWHPKQIREYHVAHKLPSHPLLSKGYASIGCYPCTSKVKDGEDPRSGRWRGLDKTECGIH